MFSTEMISAAGAVLDKCRSVGAHLVTAESCTGGLVAGCLTEIAGSSDVVDRGFVTYSNAAKMDLLGVAAEMLEEHGAVSEQVAREMAEGALRKSGAGIALAVTGIAGPGGGSAEKPVGLVHIACARAGQPTVHRRCAFGDLGRSEIRRLSVLNALELALEQLDVPMQA